jgi:DNA-binding XRE family transcriptional regulator
VFGQGSRPFFNLQLARRPLRFGVLGEDVDEIEDRCFIPERAIKDLAGVSPTEVRRNQPDQIAAGLSQKQLGLESGVQRNFISLIETGQNQPTITTIFKLALALNLKPSKLVAEAEKLLSRQAPDL